MKKFFFGVIATVLVSIASSAQGTGRVNPVEVGQLHNVYLSMGVKNAMDRDLSPHDAFLLVDFPNLTKDEESKIFEFFASKSYGEMKAQILTSFKDAKAVEYYNQIERAIDESTSISELNGKLEVIKANVNRTLSKEDWDTIMVVLETSKSSAYFWYPKDMGGSGEGTSYAYAKGGNNGPRVPGWVRADGAGAGLGMVTWGLSGLFVAGPVGGVAGFLYGTISGAVTSSMTAHINWNN